MRFQDPGASGARFALSGSIKKVQSVSEPGNKLGGGARPAHTLRYRPDSPASRPRSPDERSRPLAAPSAGLPHRDDLREKLLQILTPVEPGKPSGPLTEDDFASLSTAQFDARANALIRICRGGTAGAARMVQNVVVVFWMLGQTLTGATGSSFKRLFYRFIPTLIQVAYRDFSDDEDSRAEGARALDRLQQVLVEVSSARLTPLECRHMLSSLEQLEVFIATGDYAIANSVVGVQLRRFMERNRLRRALYHLMQAEAEIDRYVRERLGRSQLSIRLPQDVPHLSDYAPLRIFHEPRRGRSQRFMELQLPNVERPADVVVRMIGTGSRGPFDKRLDPLCAVDLLVPDDSYRLGLVYDPPELRRGGTLVDSPA